MYPAPYRSGLGEFRGLIFFERGKELQRGLVVRANLKGSLFRVTLR
jgi:hypothetical protein